MYQFTRLFFATLVPISLCGFFYFETTIANEIQFEINGLQSMPTGLTVLINTATFISSLTPLLIPVFFFATIKVVLSDFFGCIISKKDLWYIVAVSNTPLLLYNCIFDLNLAAFKDDLVASNGVNLAFMFGFTLRDFYLMNLISWALVYICLILLLLKQKVKLSDACFSVFSPSLLFCLIYWML